MSTDNTPQELADRNTILEAKNAWLINVMEKLLVMIKNAADVLEEYEKQVDLIAVELNKTKQVYSKLHTDLREALDERQRRTVRLREPAEGNADEGRAGAELRSDRSTPDPFEDS